MGAIVSQGHSRVPVYTGNATNIIGLILVFKSWFIFFLLILFLKISFLLNSLNFYIVTCVAIPYKMFRFQVGTYLWVLTSYLSIKIERDVNVS